MRSQTLLDMFDENVRTARAAIAAAGDADFDVAWSLDVPVPSIYGPTADESWQG